MEKLVRFSTDRNIPPTTPDGKGDIRYGVLEGDVIRETAALGSGALDRVHNLKDVRLLPPCSPSKIVCVGRNYTEHARELGNQPTEEPIIFLKPPSSLIAHGDAIVYPELSARVDYEGELGLVVGRRARLLRREEAWDCIFGFTCVNDVTARDLQKKDTQWTRAKGFDTFCSVGPWIVRRGQVDPAVLRVRTILDGVVKQDGRIDEMIFPADVIIAFVTRFMTLEPGDLIATGTPPGVGPMQPGSTVRVEVEGVGALENRVVRA